MLFSTTRFFSRAAVAFEEAVPKIKPLLSDATIARRQLAKDATLAKRQLKKDATAPFKRPLSGYLAFIKEKGSVPTSTKDFGSVAKANSAAWAKLSDDEKKAYSPTAGASEEYHSKITAWYNALTPEVQTVAIAMKGFPKTFVKSPRQVKWAEARAGKTNPWFDFLANYRATNDIKGLSVSEVAKAAAEAYAPIREKEIAAKLADWKQKHEKQEYEEDDADPKK